MNLDCISCIKSRKGVFAAIIGPNVFDKLTMNGLLDLNDIDPNILPDAVTAFITHEECKVEGCGYTVWGDKGDLGNLEIKSSVDAEKSTDGCALGFGDMAIQF